METKTRQQTCCFTGHRPEKLPWGYDEEHPDCRLLKSVLADVLGALYAAGYRHYICGMALGADMYFGEAVAALREERPDVTLEAAIPFDGQDRKWPPALRRRYARLTESCDECTVLSPVYTDTCMLERNRYMVDRSSLLLAVYDGRPGGTRYTVRYAADSGLEVVQLPLAFPRSAENRII